MYLHTKSACKSACKSEISLQLIIQVKSNCVLNLNVLMILSILPIPMLLLFSEEGAFPCNNFGGQEPGSNQDILEDILDFANAKA